MLLLLGAALAAPPLRIEIQQPTAPKGVWVSWDFAGCNPTLTMSNTGYGVVPVKPDTFSAALDGKPIPLAVEGGGQIPMYGTAGWKIRATDRECLAAPGELLIELDAGGSPVRQRMRISVDQERAARQAERAEAERVYREAVSQEMAWEQRQTAYVLCVSDRAEAAEIQRKRRRWAWGAGGLVTLGGIGNLAEDIPGGGLLTAAGVVTWGALYFWPTPDASLVCIPPVGERPAVPPDPALVYGAESATGNAVVYVDKDGTTHAAPFTPAAPAVPRPPDPRYSPACCKHCGPTSKPCGDSCISNNKTCHVGQGCACY